MKKCVYLVLFSFASSSFVFADEVVRRMMPKSFVLKLADQPHPGNVGPCKTGAILRKCTNISDNECSIYARTLMKNCAIMYMDKLPETICFEQAQYIGGIMGTCVRETIYSNPTLGLSHNKINHACVKEEFEKEKRRKKNKAPNTTTD
jgi:hypothetical protein